MSVRPYVTPYMDLYRITMRVLFLRVCSTVTDKLKYEGFALLATDALLASSIYISAVSCVFDM